MFLMTNSGLTDAVGTVGTADGFCANTASIWQLVGIILLIFKIVIPIVLIILGMIDLGKAVISSDDKAISKAAKSLMFRIIAAVAIFFVPSLVSFVFTVIASFSDVKDDYEICKQCITHPNSDDNSGDIKSCKYYADNE